MDYLIDFKLLPNIPNSVLNIFLVHDHDLRGHFNDEKVIKTYDFLVRFGDNTYI